MKKSTVNPVAGKTRLKLVVRGAVQGVGFRPFVFRLAEELKLAGWVNNSPQGVFIEVEGPHSALEKFLLRLEAEKPPRSFIQSLESSWLDATGFKKFEIRESETGGGKTALVMPDIATCPDCLREMFDPKNRRHRYPFTNCTNCGPRFSIIESLPYDRANTSMRQFVMCPQCQAEYDDPRNRRFHAQPNACPVCGPRLELLECGDVSPLSKRGQVRAVQNNAALLATAEAIREGKIVAVKGIGGFHFMVDARNEDAVKRLRERKHRDEKPFALMFSSLESMKAVCEVSPLEERLLHSPKAPIILLKRLIRPHPGPLPQERKKSSTVTGQFQCAPFSVRLLAKSNEAETMRRANKFQESADSCSLSPGERVRVRADVEQTHSEIAPSIAPNNPNLGVMLPSNPLHHLLMAELGFPVVATSGNLSDEPICTDEREALERLGGIADVFLVHNRPIVRHVDDSIVRVMLGREMVLRRARGYAPLPISIGGTSSTSPKHRENLERQGLVELVPPKIILAVGAHLKNAVALSVGSQVFISQHIGDLETEPANAAFRRVIADFEKLYDAKPEIIAADLHPDYLSTKFALERRSPTRRDPENLPNQHAETVLGAPRIVQVQHHIAHVLSCMAENEIEPPVLGVSWDGTGYGSDGTIWGGEFFQIADGHIERIAHLRPFRLPGGDKAVREPRRPAIGLLYEMSGDAVFSRKDWPPVAAFSRTELAALKTMLAKNLNSPVTSSIGRLFDVVASLINLRQIMRFEGQAAMELEFALDEIVTEECYELRVAAHEDARPTTTPNSALRTPHSALILDWSPMVEAILSDVQNSVAIGRISAKFHNALAEAVVAVTKKTGGRCVVLSGGCFQNRYLTERTVRRLQAEGFQPYWHQRVPPNDGGIALGQVVAALRDQQTVNRKS
jgi:hydrogenase maturation protein HypF